MLLKDLQTLATKLATGTLFHVEKAGKAYSVDYSALAKAIIEEYADSTVGGSKQSVQAAIGALNSSLATEVYAGAVSEFLSSLKTLSNSMKIGSFKYIKYTPSETTGEFVNNHLYGGFFERIGSNYWAISLTDPEGNPVYGMYRHGTWIWDRIAIGTEVDALNSRTDGIKTDNFSMNTADTYTKTLDLRTIYLVTVGKLNTRNNSYSGMYLVIPHQTESSILTIAESSALSSITIDAGTLSITTNISYVIASITRLTNMA